MAQSECRIEVVTFGCRLNALESEVMRRAGGRGRARRRACSSTPARSRPRRCARRGRRSAGRGASSPARRSSSPAARRRPSRKRFADMPEVDLVLGNAEKLHAASLPRVPDFGVGEHRARSASTTSCRVRETAAHLVEGFAAAPAPSCRCRTAATTAAPSASSPTAAGKSRSVPMGAVVEQIAGWSRTAMREVVLTGVDITAYGADLPGAPRASASWCGAILRHVPGAEAPAPLLDRFGRGGRRADARRSPRRSG